MRNLLFIFLLLVLYSEVFSQTKNLVQDSDSTEYIYVIESDTILQINYGFYKPRFNLKRQRLLRLNGGIIDSTGLRYETIPRFISRQLIGYSKDKEGQSRLLFTSGSSQRVVVINAPKVKFYNTVYPYGIFNRGDTLSTQIIKVNKDGTIKKLIDMSNILGVEDPPGIPEEIIAIIPLANNLVIETGYCDGGCYSYRYFLLENTLKPLDFSNIRNEGVGEPNSYSDFRVNFYFSHYDYDFLMAAVDYGNLPENTDLIFSKDLEDTTHIIKKHQPWEIVGENIQEGENKFFYLRSQFDNGEKVIVSYKLDSTFEKVAYQIFKDHIIDKNRLKAFNAEQLGILKNLVFAKHNYAFSTDFYRAYFNLFDFYHDDKKRASRTKDMDGLLTETDTKNLEVIKKAMKKYD